MAETFNHGSMDMQKLKLIGEVIIMAAFFGVLLWGAPLLHLALTGHYLNFGG